MYTAHRFGRETINTLTILAQYIFTVNKNKCILTFSLF